MQSRHHRSPICAMLSNGAVSRRSVCYNECAFVAERHVNGREPNEPAEGSDESWTTLSAMHRHHPSYGSTFLESLRSNGSSLPEMREQVSNDAWAGRSPAQASLLKCLLCRHRRRGMKDELVESLWPESEDEERDRHMKSAKRVCDAAASVLRNVLRIAGDESLLTTLSNSVIHYPTRASCGRMPTHLSCWSTRPFERQMPRMHFLRGKQRIAWHSVASFCRMTAIATGQ